MHEKQKRGITQKVLKRELSFLYATHRHDLFYITMKYNQNILNGFVSPAKQERDIGIAFPASSSAAALAT